MAENGHSIYGSQFAYGSEGWEFESRRARQDFKRPVGYVTISDSVRERWRPANALQAGQLRSHQIS